MRNRSMWLLVKLVVLTCSCSLLGQTSVQVPTSVDSSLLMDAAGPQQRSFLDAVYLVICPTSGAGTGFLLKSGVVVTNSHVVGNCGVETLYAISNRNARVQFTKMINDKERDLALLIPSAHLSHGLVLSAHDLPEPGTTVSTWGYPLLYNGTTPLLSVGYISGFRTDDSNGKPVKHIIVNGAFNHGNSGGPLFVARNNEVIGVVVLTFHFYPPEVRQLIDLLSNQSGGFGFANMKLPNGQTQSISEAQMTGMILDEFYKKTQVMIGEAIAASEVGSLLKEHKTELPVDTTPPVTNGR